MPVVSSIDNPEPELWAEFEKYVPQILNMRMHCVWPEPPVELSLEFAQVLSDMATFMWHAGLLAEATDALQTAEHILDHHDVGNKNPLRSNIHEHIGIVASHKGVSQRDEAMSRRDKAIVARIACHDAIPKGRITREDEIRRWNVESDMAYGLLQTEDFVRSGEIIERCHEQYRKWGTPEEIPFDYLKYYHIICYVWMAEGRPLDAIKACKQSAALGEVCCGVTHTYTQHVRCSLGNLLYFAGDIEESLKEHLRVLRARLQVVGDFNHFTLESHSMCGSLYAEQGNYKAAEYHLIQCLDQCKRSVWDRESIARAEYLYASVLEKTGRHDEAQSYLAEAREEKEHCKEKYPQWLPMESAENELAVFDQMVCMWAGRYTGKLKQMTEDPELAQNASQLEESRSSVTVDHPRQGSGSLSDQEINLSSRSLSAEDLVVVPMQEASLNG
ncbi:MAG: hypothetical protein Q9170_002074 [Blastenia crenularia]